MACAWIMKTTVSGDTGPPVPVAVSATALARLGQRRSGDLPPYRACRSAGLHGSG